MDETTLAAIMLPVHQTQLADLIEELGLVIATHRCDCGEARDVCLMQRLTVISARYTDVLKSTAAALRLARTLEA